MVWSICRQEHSFVPVRQQHCSGGRSTVLSTGAWFVGMSIAFSTGALFCRQRHCFVSVRQEHCFGGTRIVLSTGAMLCRPEHSLIDRSIPRGVLWLLRFGGRSTVLSLSDRSIVLAVGAVLCRPEHGFVDRNNAMSTGASFYRQEHAHSSIVVSTAILICRHEQCFVDRPIVLAAEALFCPSLTGALFWRHKLCCVDRTMVL